MVREEGLDAPDAPDALDALDARLAALLGGILPPGPDPVTALRDAQAGRLCADMLVDGGHRFVGAVTLAMALGYDGHVSRYVGFLASYLSQTLARLS